MNSTTSVMERMTTITFKLFTHISYFKVFDDFAIRSLRYEPCLELIL